MTKVGNDHVIVSGPFRFGRPRKLLKAAKTPEYTIIPQRERIAARQANVR